MELKQIAKNLKNGQLALLPTDTVYGIIGQYENIVSEAKIFKIKQRSKKKKLPIAVNSIEMAQQYFMINKQALKLMKKYWPGALTIISGDYALRWSDSEVLNQLIDLAGPLYLTSANISGQEPITNIKDAKKIFTNKITDYINLKMKHGINTNSTIINSNDLTIVRQGKLVIDLKKLKEN